MPSGLIGYWPLHDDSAQDLSGNGDHGTLNGGVTTGVVGKSGLEATSFGGVNGYIDIPNFPNFSAYTISVWFKSVNTSSTQDVISIRANNGTLLRIESPGKLSMFHDTGASNQIVSRPTISSNTWYHAVISWDGSTATAYLDGEQIGQVENSNNGSDGAFDTIGAGGGGEINDFVNGTIADVRVYNRTLSDREIKTLYEWGSADLANDPRDGVARYALDGDATDSFGTNDGTNINVSFVNDSIRGQSGEFTGSEYIDTPINLSTYDTTGFTISSWFKFNVEDDFLAIFSADDNINFGVTNNERLRISDSLAGSMSSNKVLSTENWYFGAATYDPSNGYRLYVNGVNEHTNTDTSISSGTTTQDIGRENGSGFNNYLGNIDDLRIYDYALEPHEVFELYRWGTFGRDMREYTVNL